MLEHGADAGIVSFELELPLDVAQGADMLALLKDWMQRQSIDETAARSAEEQQMLKDAREWLASGQYPVVVDPRTGATALHIAAAKGYSEVLELLLKLPGVEVDATDVDGWTPLHAAAHWAKEKPLRLLAAAGASFDAITLTVSALPSLGKPNQHELYDFPPCRTSQSTMWPIAVSRCSCANYGL